MSLPQEFLESLKGIAGFNQSAFEQVHLSGEQVTSVRLNPAKTNGIVPTALASQAHRIPWTEMGYYLETRPSFTFDPYFHAGAYYVQEASSMFLEQALIQTADTGNPLRVLDLCASPGGKSTHLQSLLTKDSLLVSNEVIRSRANVLKDNIIKWGAENVLVTHNDPKDFGAMNGFFDVIVVDAPCSGSGLFRRDPEAIEEWSLNNVQLCSQRQQRILSDIWPALKPGGILIYSTCSFSAEEDELIIEWMQSVLQARSCTLQLNPAWGICETSTTEGNRGYRFWPDKLKGEGFFLACFRKVEGAEWTLSRVRKQPESLNKQEKELVYQWIQPEGKRLIRHQQTVYAWPEEQSGLYSFILGTLRVIYSGVRLGDLMRNKLVPDHALAMSLFISPGVNRVALSTEEAVAYLQRKDLDIPGNTTGWALAMFEGQVLGWMNILPGRVNNYYPKELRILREI